MSVLGSLSNSPIPPNSSSPFPNGESGRTTPQSPVSPRRPFTLRNTGRISPFPNPVSETTTPRNPTPSSPSRSATPWRAYISSSVSSVSNFFASLFSGATPSERGSNNVSPISPIQPIQRVKTVDSTDLPLRVQFEPIPQIPIRDDQVSEENDEEFGEYVNIKAPLDPEKEEIPSSVSENQNLFKNSENGESDYEDYVDEDYVRRFSFENAGIKGPLSSNSREKEESIDFGSFGDIEKVAKDPFSLSSSSQETPYDLKPTMRPEDPKIRDTYVLGQKLITPKSVEDLSSLEEKQYYTYDEIQKGFVEIDPVTGEIIPLAEIKKKKLEEIEILHGKRIDDLLKGLPPFLFIYRLVDQGQELAKALPESEEILQMRSRYSEAVTICKKFYIEKLKEIQSRCNQLSMALLTNNEPISIRDLREEFFECIEKVTKQERKDHLFDKAFHDTSIEFLDSEIRTISTLVNNQLHDLELTVFKVRIDVIKEKLLKCGLCENPKAPIPYRSLKALRDELDALNMPINPCPKLEAERLGYILEIDSLFEN